MQKLGMLLAAGLLAGSASAAVGVSINVGQPGFYGQINLGDAPPPRLVYSQPVYVERQTVEVEPIYLRVPMAHRSHWRENCYRYNACGRPVYFVQDRWYNDVYVPHYRQHYQERDGGWRGDDRRWERHDNGRWHEGGRGDGRDWHGEGRGDGDHRGGRDGGHDGGDHDGHGHDR